LSLAALIVVGMDSGREPHPRGVDRAHEHDDDPDRLLTVKEVAAFLRVRPDWVYAHARELGGWRLLGDRGPWRFSRQNLATAPGAPARRRSHERPFRRAPAPVHPAGLLVEKARRPQRG